MNLTNTSRQKMLRIKAPADSVRQDDAFTITDLLFVILALAMLAIVVFPSFAGVQNKGGRVDCANNLRQIGQDSMIYAGEHNGLLPVCTFGAGNDDGLLTNHLESIVYTYYVYLGNANAQVSTNAGFIQPGNGFQNLGYLFQAGLAGNGSIFYCPSQWRTEYGANAYSPLLTTDSGGIVRSGYIYNPRMASPNASNPIRRYQTVSQLEPHRLFAMDLLLASGSGAGVNPASIVHARDHGWNVLFTDGSVQFDRLSINNNYYYNLIVNELVSNESEASYLQYDQVYDFLEQDH